MKKIAKISLIVLAVIVALLIALYVVAGFVVGFDVITIDNIKAAIKGFTTNQEDLLTDKANNEKEQVDVLNKHGYQITYEDMEKIDGGEMTKEEIKDMLLGSPSTGTPQQDGDKTETPPADNTTQDGQKDTPPVQQPEKDAEQENTKYEPQKAPVKDTQPAVPDESENDEAQGNQKPEPPKQDDKAQTPVQPQKNPQGESGEKKPSDSPAQPPPTTPQYNEVDERIAEIIAEMYVYKSHYTSSIAAIVSSMYYEFYALPVEQQVYSSKVSIYNSRMGEIAAMEAQCDAQVYALVGELRTLLRENGRDESLADSLLSAYATEKENSKAYHISRYAD